MAAPASLQTVPKDEGGASARYYAPVEQLARLERDFDYFIVIEGAPAAFEKNRPDLELLLRNLVVE